VALEIGQKNGAAISRLAGAMVLFLFAISFAHFSSEQAHQAWSKEIALHHAGIPLALFVLLQNYRFLLLDAFLRFVVNATLAADANDIVEAVVRARAVSAVRLSADFESISVAFKRMKNILRQAREANKKIAEALNPSALAQPEEKKLAETIPQVAKDVDALRNEGKYEQALLEISRLRPMIDAFFDKVMVMVEDEALRANRLGLLQTLVNEFSRIADFSEIVTEGQNKP